MKVDGKKLTQEEKRELAEQYGRSLSMSYRLAKWLVCATLLCNVLFFFFKFWDGSLHMIYATPCGLSTLLNMTIVAMFAFGLSPFAFTRFVAFASAGFFLYWTYSVLGNIEWAAVAMWVCVGVVSAAMAPRFVAIWGVAALVFSILANLKFF